MNITKRLLKSPAQKASIKIVEFTLYKTIIEGKASSAIGNVEYRDILALIYSAGLEVE